MSRNGPQPVARYKISSPQPYVNPDSQPVQSGNGSFPPQSPARPARSRMREQQQPGMSPPSPARPARALRPIQTELRRPSDQSLSGSNIVSPISPDHPPAVFQDPFAADRSQRSELRAQAVTRQTPPLVPAGNEKLRSVVGAFISAGKGKDDPRRPNKSEARRARAPREQEWEISEGGGKFSELDTVLHKIKADWPFVLESDFSASTLALSLLSKSPSSHPSLPSFIRLHEALSVALQSAVQAHFQSFAASLPAHAQFITTLSRAQDQVRTSRESLKEARDGFAGKGKSELAGVRARERTVRDMLSLLDTIDHLKDVPHQLETLIGDKKFLQAAHILVRSLRTINKPELAQIGALSDLKLYFKNQETTLSDILVDELQSHLYLKTFYSDARWQAHVPGQVSLSITEEPDNAAAGPGPSSRLSRYLSGLATRSAPEIVDYESDLSPASAQQRDSTIASSSSTHSVSAMANNPDVANPEAESYAYMETVLEALSALGRLGPALDEVAQRVSTEIHALVEVTLDEVEERSSQRRDASTLRQANGVHLSGDVTVAARRQSLVTPMELSTPASSLDAIGPPQHAEVLRDLFWTLYSKLAAVLEGHRVVFEVARWISSRREFKEGLAAIPVQEIWKPIQQEVRALLYAYLAETDATGLERHSVVSVNEALREGKVVRDRQRQMFKFSDTDNRAVLSDIKPIDNSVQQALKTSVPGLVYLHVSEGSQSVGSTQGDLAIDDIPGSRHRTLIPPNPFNVSTLFQPTLAFIDRASAVVPPGFETETEAFGSTLEDFVVNVFLPQLDEKVTESFQQAVSGYDAFQIERALAGEVEKPPLKSSVRVMDLIHRLCLMLQTTPFHRENYSRLIIGVIVQYYQQCSTRFKDLTVDASQSPALPALWAQREDVIQILTDVRAVAPFDRHENAEIAAREVKLAQELLAGKRVLESQLLSSARKLEALGQLGESLRWFIDSLLDIQSVSEDPLSPGGVFQQCAYEPGDPPRLPLTKAMNQRYEAIVQTYEQLAEMIFNTMRLEIRGRIMCNLAASLQKDDYRMESEALEPDPDVMDLSSTLTESDDLATRTLSVEDKNFMFRGTGHLVDHMFIWSARTMKAINAAGVRKIQRNILSLQQSLRGISPSEGSLSRSMAYWDLFFQNPQEMLDSIRDAKPLYSFDNYNAMLHLQCKTDPNQAPSSELNTYLIDLHALSMSAEGWESGI